MSCAAQLEAEKQAEALAEAGLSPRFHATPIPDFSHPFKPARGVIPLTVPKAPRLLVEERLLPKTPVG